MEAIIHSCRRWDVWDFSRSVVQYLDYCFKDYCFKGVFKILKVPRIRGCFFFPRLRACAVGMMCVYDSRWVQHWIHAGQLSIKGLKMSKSLKNYISIQDYLSQGGSPALWRIFCLLHRHEMAHIPQISLLLPFSPIFCAPCPDC